MNTVIAMDSGTVSSEMTASSGLIQNMIAMTPMIVHSAVISWVRVCWSELAMLSMSFVTRLSVSPRGCAVEVAEREARQLRVDVAAHPVDGPLDDAGHDVRLAPGEQRAQDVDRRDEQEHVAERLKSMPSWPGVTVMAGEHVRLLGLAGGAQRIDRLLLGEAGRDLLADDAVEDDVRRVAEDLRTDDGAGHAQDGEQRRRGRSVVPRAGAARRDAGTMPLKFFGFSGGSPGPPNGPPPPNPRGGGRRAAARAALGRSRRFLFAELRVDDLAIRLAGLPSARRGCRCRRSPRRRGRRSGRRP